MTSPELVNLFLALGALLGVARVFGEIANRFHQPSVLGEILAGIVLGPTILGHLAPGISEFLFPQGSGVSLVLDGFSMLAIVLFLMVAGIEVDLSTVWKQGKTALRIGVAGILFPFALGFVAACLFPEFLGRAAPAHPILFSSFFATALAISALPVIARTLMDLNLYRSDLGMVVMASATLNDLIGWLIFSVLLSTLGSGALGGFGISTTVLATLGFTVFALTGGRWLINLILPWVQAHSSWPGGVLGFSICLALVAAAFTEWIGVHAIFGSFILGVVIGDSPHLREHTRNILTQFVSFIFAPLFFASIGLKLDFARHFDPGLTLVVLILATVGKVLGCRLAASRTKLPAREAWAISFAMNGRGAMEIILGLLALQHQLINERMFVSLVIMALATSMMSGPIMQALLRRKQPRRFYDYLGPRTFVAPLLARDRWEAIRELAQPTSASSHLSPARVEEAVRAREQTMPTGLSHGIALPHAQVDSLSTPVVALGLSKSGIDFDARDGEPTRLVFLILSPPTDEGAALEIYADILKTFRNPAMVAAALESTSYTEFLALLKSTKV